MGFGLSVGVSEPGTHRLQQQQYWSVKKLVPTLKSLVNVTIGVMCRRIMKQLEK